MNSKIFYNGQIMTMEKENEYVEAIYVKDGIIEKCGSYEALKECFEAETEYIDLQGKTMLPAFIDGHSHFAAVGRSQMSADLSDCKNFDDIVEKMKKHIELHKLPEGSVVTGINYDHNYLEEKKHPTKDVLDRISSNHMIIVSHISGHMGSVNSPVLKKMGLTDESEYGIGGRYYRYENSRELNGYMEENAFMEARRIGKNPPPEQIKEMILMGEEEYLKNGITTVQNGAGTADEMNMLMDIAEDNKFHVDVVNYLMINSVSKEQMAGYDMYRGNYHNHLKVGGYKMFFDGSPQGKTAWLSKPYENETEYRGYPVISDEDAIKYAQRAIEENCQLIAHCNGDEASEQFIRIYDGACDENNIKNKLRPVMIHSQTVRKDQLERMMELGMIPSIFVAHTYYWGDVHYKNLGEKRASNISPARWAIDAGHIINFHQDSPVLKPNMLETIWCAVNRTTRSGKEIGPNQRISVYEALRAATYGGAFEYFEEDMKGTIKEGKAADLIVLSANPMKVEKMKIKDINVLQTYKNGNLVYSL